MHNHYGLLPPNLLFSGLPVWEERDIHKLHMFPLRCCRITSMTYTDQGSLLIGLCIEIFGINCICIFCSTDFLWWSEPWGFTLQNLHSLCHNSILAGERKQGCGMKAEACIVNNKYPSSSLHATSPLPIGSAWRRLVCKYINITARHCFTISFLRVAEERERSTGK